ncbi:MAG: HAMP domain-containing sensor histidine kinase [Zetaproteobacteria bacterium]|nr:HAMP domain-containing sensor histidine kinase [Zetaproteobacteria bacterium]
MSKSTPDKKLNCEDPRLWQHDRLASVGLVAAGLVHELQNQVGGILLFSQALDRQGLDVEVVETLAEIEKVALHSKALIRDFLDFLRPPSPEGIAPERDRADVSQSIADAWKIAALKQSSQGDVEFRVAPFEGTPTVSIPKHQLVQIFLNLFVNACEAMQPQGGSLEVRFSQELGSSNSVRGVWEVEDTGPGMSPDVLHKIFEPFFSSKGVGKGTGLGLVICRQLCRTAGGDLTCKSRVSMGSTFRVILPLN